MEREKRAERIKNSTSVRYHQIIRSDGQKQSPKLSYPITEMTTADILFLKCQSSGNLNFTCISQFTKKVYRRNCQLIEVYLKTSKFELSHYKIPFHMTYHQIEFISRRQPNIEFFQAGFFMKMQAFRYVKDLKKKLCHNLFPKNLNLY